jgi:hypothetical protein
MVLEGTRDKRTMKSWHENAAWNWGAAQLWTQECVEIERVRYQHMFLQELQFGKLNMYTI